MNRKILSIIMILLFSFALISCDKTPKPRNGNEDEETYDLGGIDFNIRANVAERINPRSPEFERMYRNEKLANIEKVEKKYNIKVNYINYPANASWGVERDNWIIQQAQTGQTDSHVFEVTSNSVANLAVQGAILPLDDLIEKYGNKGLWEKKRSFGTVLGKSYVYDDTFSQAEEGIYYNSELLAAVLGEERKLEPTKLWNLPIRYVLGYWTLSSSPIDIIAVEDNNFIRSKHFYSKEEIPSETTFEIMDGYKYNVTFYKEIDGILDGGKELENLTTSLTVDYKFWEDFNYIGITVFPINTKNLSNKVNTTSKKLIVKVPYEVILHEEVDVFFTTGYWPDDGIEIKTGTDNFTKGFLASNILSINQVPVNTKITITEGYKIRLVFFTYSPKEGYKVAKRTSNYMDEVLVTEELYENYDYIAINISAVTSTDLSGLASTAHELITFILPD